MKRLLILCDDYPPYGGLRAGMFAKYLLKNGWQSEVVSYKFPDSVDAIFDVKGGTPAGSIHRVYWDTSEQQKWLGANRSLKFRATCFIKPELTRPPGLVGAFQKACLAVLKNRGPFDFILATTSCVDPILRVARDLSNRFSVPWGADLRDLLELRSRDVKMTLRERLYVSRAILRRNHLLQSASFVSTISKWAVDRMKKCCDADVLLIYNGFDPELFDPEKPKFIASDTFDIVYTGSLLDASTRDPTILFKACRRLLRENIVHEKNLRLKFYGRDASKVGRYADAFACASITEAKGCLPHRQIPDILARSSVLLLLTSRSTKGVMTTKAFEYLASGKRILCIPEDDGSLKDLLLETKAGRTCDTVEDVAEFLGEAYACWLRFGEVARTVDPAAVAKYSRGFQAMQLAAVLDRCVMASLTDRS